MSTKPKIIAIVGPTASGKSEFAVRLAKKFNGEIISADSQQVYRKLDIGTGKVPGIWKLINIPEPTNPRPLTSWFTKKRPRKTFLYKGVSHHCIDFVSPRKKITVAEYKLCADRAIREIHQRGKLPILVGGTGFWVDTVAFGTELPRVRPNQKLRRALDKKNAKELIRILKKIDKKRAQTVDQKNPRRIIRAIEIARALGKVPKINKKNPYEVLWLGKNIPEKKWKRIVQKRVHAMISSGIVRETQRILRFGISRKRIEEFGFEYSEVLSFLEGRLNFTDLAKELIRGTYAYGRRQMTWFMKNPEIRWVSGREKAEKLTAAFTSPKKELV